MKIKKCLFCMRSHKKTPKLCTAKGAIISAYLKEGLQFWQVMAGIERGLIDLEGTALKIVKENKK